MVDKDDDKPSIIDIEECAKKGEKPDYGRKYRISVQGKYYEVDKAEITGREIIDLTRLSPNEYEVQEKLHDGTRKKIALDEKVNLVRDPCPERFELVPIAVNQG